MIVEIKEQNKRFLCFGAYMYEAYGGIGDLKDSFDTKEEAVKWLTDDSLPWEIKAIYDRIEDIQMWIKP
jgi:hypothetical protein